LIVAPSSGYVSLSVFRWARDAGVEIVIVDEDAEIVSAPAGGISDARVRRVQAAPPPGLALDAARLMLRPKLLNQSRVLRDVLRANAAAETLETLADALDHAEDVDACRQVEATSAAAYFGVWRNHPATTLRFTNADAAKVPAHWLTFTERRSPLSTGTARKAASVLNAVLNLTYHFGAISTRAALVAVGIDPALGFVHADQRGKDAAVFDAIECIRPIIDGWVLTALVAERTWTRKDVFEMSDGSVRIAPKLTQEIAESVLPLSGRAVAPHVEELAHLLGRAVTGKWQPTTRLTGRNAKIAAAQVKARKLAAADVDGRSPISQVRQSRTRLNQPELFATCLQCGGRLSRSRHLYCEGCQDLTPGHSRETRRKRGQAIAATRAKLEAWKTEHPEDVADVERYRREILPGLASVKLAEIMIACEVSKTTASDIRSGKRAPAARHVATLEGLAKAASETRS
jgi:CRISPR-associated endonuclease Cas1